MVAREVPFVGNSSLLYSWANLNQFFKAYEIKNVNEWDVFWRTKLGDLDFENDYPKIIMYGLNRKGSPSTIEEANELFEEFMEDHTLQDIQELLISAQMSALVNTETQGEVKGETMKPPQRSRK